jgi:hypothetical protein
MLARMRPRLTYANVMATLAFFLALSTGGAYATHLVVNSSDVVDNSLIGADVKGKAGTSTTASVNGSLTTDDISGQQGNPAVGSPFVQGSLTTWDVADGTLRSADVLDNSLGAGDLAPNSVNTSEVADNSLTGADIKDQSGVDTCVAATTRFGQLCFRAENSDRNWNQALEFCADLDLRLPSVAEAVELARTQDLPNVATTEDFWTDELIGQEVQEAVLVDDGGSLATEPPNALKETACVTTPTN